VSSRVAIDIGATLIDVVRLSPDEEAVDWKRVAIDCIHAP
jgi:hypothetical protein